MGENILKPAIPVLFVRDVRSSAGFYRDRLGFGVDFLYGDPPFYGSVSRGGACLHLRCVHDPNFSDLAAREKFLILATIEVTDVQSLYREFEERDVEFAQMPTRQPGAGRIFTCAIPTAM